MNAGMKALLIENLKKLKLSTMIRNLEALIRQTKQDKLSYEEFLLNLSEAEVQARQENGRKRRLREAKFPILKPMETFNFDAAPELDVRLMKELSSCDYVKKGRNIIFLGKSGTGKTHLATALGMEACKQGIRTRFVSGCGLANGLNLRHRHGSKNKMHGRFPESPGRIAIRFTVNSAAVGVPGGGRNPCGFDGPGVGDNHVTVML